MIFSVSRRKMQNIIDKKGTHELNFNCFVYKYIQSLGHRLVMKSLTDRRYLEEESHIFGSLKPNMTLKMPETS